MYETFYGLREKPFSLVPDPDFLFLGRLHGAALNMLEYGLRGEASFTLISGEVGCGKTILIRRFLRMVDDSTTIGMVTNTPRSKGLILERILLAFGLNYRDKSEVEQYESLIEFLEEQQTHHRRSVLIIDEAHNLDENSLEELRMLSNINVDKSLALQVILVGQPEILELLNTRSLRQLAQRISVNFRLLPLTFSETRRYIRHRLRVAGGGPDIFEIKAIAIIHLLSGGIPRVINILCDTALVYGFGESQETLNAEIIQTVASDTMQGGLETFPVMDYDLGTEEILEAADKLVESLDSDELGDENDEPSPPTSDRANQFPVPEATIPEADCTGSDLIDPYDSDNVAEAGEDPDVPRRLIPIVDTSANKGDGAMSHRVIMVLVVIAATTIVAGGILWFFWPTIERMRVSWTDSANQLAISDEWAAADTAPAVPQPDLPKPGVDGPVGQLETPVVPLSARRLIGAAAESGSSLPEASIEETAEPPPSEVIDVSPPDTPDKPQSNANTSLSEAGEGVQEPQAVLDDVITGDDAITVPKTLDDALGRLGDAEGDFGAALAGLFEQWNQDFSAIAGAEPCDKAFNAGLSCYERDGNLDKLIRFNRPAIVRLRRADRGTAHALLAGLKGDKVRLLIDDYEIMVPRDEANSLMAGPFLLLWSPPSGYQGLLVEGRRGETIVWLRAELKKILGGDVDVGEGEVFDAVLTQAVREFQEHYDLQVDGIVGIETLIKINSVKLGDEVPRLE
jgi:type II secretory pathway predicted ATPase ExeA/peptidoglycan hydrolase-like protein with peptidoglycan-binding domain